MCQIYLFLVLHISNCNFVHSFLFVLATILQAWKCSFRTKICGNCTSTLLLLLLADIPWNAALIGSTTQHPSPPRDHGKKNHPPSSQPPRLPRKMRPRRRKERHHHHQQQHHAGNAPGTDPCPKGRMRTSVKHPQLPQHPQHPRPAANEISSRVNLLDQADHSQLYKWATSSRGKESTERSCRDYFSGSSLSFSSKRPHRDYFSGSPYRETNKNKFMTDPP